MNAQNTMTREEYKHRNRATRSLNRALKLAQNLGTKTIAKVEALRRYNEKMNLLGDIHLEIAPVKQNRRAVLE